VDGTGQKMVDFYPDDFVVAEGGQDREILDVRVADYPIAILLDDTADSATWAAIRSAASRFITRIGERPVAVGVLSGSTLVASLEDSRQSVLERISTLPGHPGAATITLLPAVAEATRIIRETETPFSAVIVIAATTVNDTGPVPASLLPGILESGATIHVVQGQPAPRPTQSTPDSGDLLKTLADQTHGEYTRIFSAVSFSIALDRLADRLSSEMMVEYLVPPGVAAGDVRVGVRRPGARALGLGVSK
jgi:hypothetical protein